MSILKKQKDKLGRDYVVIHDNKTVLKKFRGDSNQIKSIYHIFGDLENPRSIEVDFINKDGNEIIANYSTTLGFNFKTSDFVGFSSRKEMGIRFPVNKEKIKEWYSLLKK